MKWDNFILLPQDEPGLDEIKYVRSNGGDSCGAALVRRLECGHFGFSDDIHAIKWDFECRECRSKDPLEPDNPSCIKGTCQTCFHSGAQVLYYDQPAGPEAEEAKKHLICRRNPPVLTPGKKPSKPKSWSQPRVMLNDLCGEWRAIEE